ncbi:SDR family oxidoreductase [Halosegnis rubeus]|uniref:SDR family oxidoreductase n=1 Tax=Halosegnis rubeus TaxID=2212850 RepID=A0A5N5U2N9_9EURY|nr:SDR family oxidoreductase [Halosegnis rubeus]KAB7515567.1 SDR family oxidoreductase [Halosegnis rubeus]KAB7518645.1 SDR family oxidoreductase [Halosegnis rubeus]
MGQVGHLEDVAPAFLWLANEAAGCVTGELLHADGGLQAS